METDETQIVPMPGIKVPSDAKTSGYRVTIPARIRDAYSIEPGDEVNLRVRDGVVTESFTTTVDTKGRVLLSDGAQAAVEPGSTIDMELVR